MTTVKISNTFIKILRENGIKIPGNPKNRLQEVKVNLFNQRWDEVSKLYQELRCSMHRLKGAETSLKEKWGIEASTCGPMLRFRNPQQAKKVLDRELKRFQECEDEVRNLIRFERIEWVQDIIRNVPEGTKLVVIKNNEYVPDPVNQKKFEAATEAGKPSYIATCGVVIEWVSFAPNNFDLNSSDLDFWAPTPKKCSVQYIS